MARQFCHAEADARKKWCPFARGSSIARERVISEANKEYTNRCIASDCMAWRWVETHITNPDAPQGDLIPSGDTHGYCGLGGA